MLSLSLKELKIIAKNRGIKDIKELKIIAKNRGIKDIKECLKKIIKYT